MSDKIRWGVLSTANIGRKRVIPAIQQSKNGVVTAVASRDYDRARTFADALDLPTAYGSYDELIADPNIDAIYNPLPNSEHAEWSIKCAKAGKPTLCEKPLASDAPEAQTMVDAFAEHNVLFAEAFMYRFHPQTQHVKQLVDEGAIGDLHTIQATFNFRIPPENTVNIRLNESLAGGSLMDVGCYCVNIIRLITGGMPQKVQAFAQMGADTQVDERLTGILQFDSSVMAHFDSSLRSHLAHSYEIRGSKGRIYVPEAFVMSPLSSTTIHAWLGDTYEAIEIPPANSYTLMAEDFADALINNRPPKYLPQDGVANMQVIDRLLATL